ncbi:MAG: hypothetical protein R2854_17630 [Caldilineaceae bacterium]
MQPGDVGRQFGRVEDGAGLVAIVPLVAHVERLGQQRADVQPAGRDDGVAQHRRHDLVHPAQPRLHVFLVRTVAQHLAVAFVEIAEGPVAAARVGVRLVFDDVDRHGRRRDARHGADGVVMVARRKLDLAGGGQRFGLRRVGRAPFKDERPMIAAQRTGHAFP